MPVVIFLNQFCRLSLFNLPLPPAPQVIAFLKMDFETLLQQAQKLTNETQGSDEFPRVERTLPQVLQATHELHSRVTQTGSQDIQA